MKGKFSILIALFFIAAIAINGCKPKQQAAAEVYDYEAVYGGTQGVDGTTMVKVTAKGKKAEEAVENCKKYAVHAIMFRGIPGSNMAKPIITEPNAETKNVDYFNKFFAPSGKYLSFMTPSGDGPQDKIKIKEGYKVTMLINVKHKNLRKQLEDDGIAKKMTDGF